MTATLDDVCLPLPSQPHSPPSVPHFPSLFLSLVLSLSPHSEHNSHSYTTHHNTRHRLIHYVNLDGRVNVFYSTPAAYVAAKAAYPASDVAWPVKTDDFFPYADCPHCYWTGTLLWVGWVRWVSE